MDLKAPGATASPKYWANFVSGYDPQSLVPQPIGLTAPISPASGKWAQLSQELLRLLPLLPGNLTPRSRD